MSVSFLSNLACRAEKCLPTAKVYFPKLSGQAKPSLFTKVLNNWAKTGNDVLQVLNNKVKLIINTAIVLNISDL
jgi:hypothetical protein